MGISVKLIDMKFILFLFFLSPLVYANDDDFCYQDYGKDVTSAEFNSQVKKYCKDNNILVVFGLDERGDVSRNWIAYRFCRFDREILFFRDRMSCQIHSTSGRGS